MNKLKAKVVKYSKKLNSTNLSALRSGNISTRAKEKNIDGFYITPSGMKYSSLKPKDIVFVSLKGRFDKKKGIPSSEWRFHQDIYVNKKSAKAIVHTHSTCATAVSSHEKSIPAFHYMVGVAGGEDIKCTKYATFGTRKLSRNILSSVFLIKLFLESSIVYSIAVSSDPLFNLILFLLFNIIFFKFSEK